MAHINMMGKTSNKFKMVQLDDRLRFNKFLEENENIVPCSIYVDKDTGVIYFIEEQTGPIMDLYLYDTDTCINESSGLLIGKSIGI